METLKTIVRRKSTRNFNPDKTVSKEDIHKIILAGCASPVGASEYESLHITVVQGDTLKSVADYAQQAFHTDQSPLYNAPVFIILSASEKQTYPNAQYANSACVIENMLLSATDLGIDSVYIWGVITVIADNQELLDILKIPKGFRPVSGALFGYSLEKNESEKELSVTIPITYI